MRRNTSRSVALQVTGPSQNKFIPENPSSARRHFPLLTRRAGDAPLCGWIHPFADGARPSCLAVATATCQNYSSLFRFILNKPRASSDSL